MMSKRCGQDLEFNSHPAVKKTKINDASQQNKTQDMFQDYDLWNEDIEKEIVKEVDYIVSQEICKETSLNMNCPVNSTQSSVTDYLRPSTSSTSGYVTSSANCQPPENSNNCKINSTKQDMKPPDNEFKKFKNSRTLNSHSSKTVCSKTSSYSDVLASSSSVKNLCSRSMSNLKYTEFKQSSSVYNSTQQQFSKEGASYKKNVEQYTLRSDVKALMNKNSEMLTQMRQKDGEISYLRERLRKLQKLVDNEKKDKEEQLKNQEKKYSMDISIVRKEKEEIKTQFELKNFELETLSNKFKLLEAGTIRLVKPRASSNGPAKLNASFYRSDIYNQSANSNINDSWKTLASDKVKLRVLVNDCPLKNIPESIYETSLAEKPVVNIQIVEKSGRRNLPILQEEDSLRIFENPELVKPLVTMMGNEELKVKFYLSDLTELITKSEREINSISTMPIINKLVATTRELLLNSTAVLQKIADVMTNDDVRDMNEKYFAEVYNTPVFHTKSIFDGSSWHDEERGIETRRSLGVLSHVASNSIYLSEYISGRTTLLTKNDDAYKKYIIYMNNYDCWPLKNTSYEFLQLLLKFVSVVRAVRRAHQFTGLLSAVALTLINAQRTVPFEESGIIYAFRILKEIILSRPLLQAFIPLTQMIEVFGKSSLFAKELYKSTRTASPIVLQNIIHFKLDSCVIEMYLKQLKYFKLDEITMIKITDALVSFIYLDLCKRMVIRKSDNSPMIEFLHCVIRLLCDCLNVNTEMLKLMSRANKSNCSLPSKLNNFIPDDWNILSDEFWNDIRFMQFNALKKGICFFNYLRTHEHGTFRLLDSEVRLTMFSEKILKVDGLVLQENEMEALTDLKKDLKQYNALTIKQNSDNQKRVETQIMLYKNK